MHFPQLAQATSKFPSDVYCRLMFCSVPFCGWNEREGRGEGKGREGKGEIELRRASFLRGPLTQSSNFAHQHSPLPNRLCSNSGLLRAHPFSYHPATHSRSLTRITASSWGLRWFWQIRILRGPHSGQQQSFLSNLVTSTQRSETASNLREGEKLTVGQRVKRSPAVLPAVHWAL
jgi:hypothetical protein